MYIIGDTRSRPLLRPRWWSSVIGAPEHPDWYWNLTAAGEAHVERGTDEYDVTVDEVKGDERDRLYAEQVGRRQSFAEYEQKTAGIRTIPVLRLRRV